MSRDARKFVDRLQVKPMGAKYILYRIAAMINDATFECWPGQDYLARVCGCTTSQVKQHIAAMVKTGTLIRSERKSTTTGLWASNTYRIAGYEEWYHENAEPTPVKEEFQEMARRVEGSHDAPADASTDSRLSMDNKPVHGQQAVPRHRQPAVPRHRQPAVHEIKESEIEDSKKRLSSQISEKDAYFAGESAPKKSGSRKRQGSLPIEETAEARTDVDGLAKMDEADVKAFCAVADEFGLAKPERLSAVRRDKLRSLRREHGASAWGRALAAVKASSFLQGKAGKIGAFRVSFDKLLDPEFFLKVIEGTYADKAATVIKLKTNATRHEWGFRLEIWQKSGFATWSRIWGPPPGDPACVAPADLIEEYRAKGMPDPDAVTAR